MSNPVLYTWSIAQKPSLPTLRLTQECGSSNILVFAFNPVDNVKGVQRTTPSHKISAICLFGRTTFCFHSSVCHATTTVCFQYIHACVSAPVEKHFSILMPGTSGVPQKLTLKTKTCWGDSKSEAENHLSILTLTSHTHVVASTQTGGACPSSVHYIPSTSTRT